MADDPVNQQQFMEDVKAAAARSPDGASFMDVDGSKMPSIDEVWQLIEQMDGISDEERANIRESLYNPKDGDREEFLRRMMQPSHLGHSSWDYITFCAMITVLFFLFALFGYKLYKSLMEKEHKKLEKIKSKQSKKTKKMN